MRDYLLGEETEPGDLAPLLAELYAISDADKITVETGRQMILRLRSRGLRRELAKSEGDRKQELQEELMSSRSRSRRSASADEPGYNAAADPR